MLQHRTGRPHPARGLILVAALLAVAGSIEGCTREEAEPATAAPPAASAPEPAADPRAAAGRRDPNERRPMFDGSYAPLSRTAESITDELAFEDDTLQFGLGHTYETRPVSIIQAGDEAGRGFTEVLSAPVGTYLEIRQVTAELVNPRAPNGGLCRPDATRWIVLAAVRDGNDTTATVAMAAYKGQAAPTSATAETDLCGAFTYTRPAS